jgi:hypothetical protein
MKYSTIKNSLILFLIVSALIYLSYVFINWQFNPYHWSIEQRESFAKFVMISFLLSPLALKFNKLK